MKIHNLGDLAKFIKKHRTAKKDIDNWRAFVEGAHWSSSDDVKLNIRGEKSDRLVFKLGDRWRIDTRIEWEHELVLIIRVGSHEEYNKWKYQ